MLNFKKVLALALTYVGAIIGAGFASGQELLHFFVRYGFSGLLGTLVAGIGFVVFGAAIFRIAARERVTSYHELLPILVGEKLGRVADLCFSFYLFMGLVIMLAGCGAVFWETLNLSTGLGIGLSSLALAIALFWKEDGVVTLNAILVPLIIFGAILVTVLVWQKTGFFAVVTKGGLDFSWLGSAFLYVSYNLIGGLVILIRFTDSHRQEGIPGIFLGGIILALLAGMLSLVLLKNYSTIAEQEVPLLALAENRNVFLGLAYGVVLWFAMLTTAAVDAAALALRVNQKKTPYWLTTLLLILISSALANIGFSVLIKTIYPLFGYLGLALLGGMLVKFLAGYD